MEVIADKILLFVSAPPKNSPSTGAKIFKGVSAKNCSNSFLNLEDSIGKNHMLSDHVGKPQDTSLGVFRLSKKTARQLSAETIRIVIEVFQNL
jgi:REP element-mobilizing transposase RayT